MNRLKKIKLPGLRLLPLTAAVSLVILLGISSLGSRASALAIVPGQQNVYPSGNNAPGAITGSIPQGPGPNCHAYNFYILTSPTAKVTASSFPSGSSAAGTNAKPLTPSGNNDFLISNVPPGTYALYLACDVLVSTGKYSQSYQMNGPIITITTTANGSPLQVQSGQTTNVNASAPTTNNGNGSAAKVTPTCDTSNDPLTWILCPVFNDVAGLTDWVLKNFVQPLLKTTPVSTDPANPTYQIWSNFRIYGNILLIVALIVVVFGEAIGGGLIEAYTARKMLPRVLIAAILINLSVYIVALLVDITNILGSGIGEIITAPLKNAAQFQFTLNAVQGGGVIAIAGGATIFGFFTGILAAGSITALFAWIGLFVLMPAAFAVLAAFLTIVLRQGLILFLILVSPVAFAMYCLPNTEKYFKKWWDLLWQTLLVYPIIMIIFAIADVLSVTIMDANSGFKPNTPLLAQGAVATNNVFAALVSFVALFLPLILIPYAFRLAGGALGKIHETLTNYHHKAQEGIKGNPNDPLSLRNMTRDRMRAAMTRSQAQHFRRNKDRRFGVGTAAGMIWGKSLEQEALLNEASQRRIFATKDRGDDSILNAAASFIDTDGKRKTLDGNEVKPGEWAAARRRYRTLSDIQTVADYRSTKILTTPEAEQFTRNFGMMAQQLGLTPEEATSAFTALSFARQNERGEFKFGRYDKDYNYHPAGEMGSFAVGEVRM